MKIQYWLVIILNNTIFIFAQLCSSTPSQLTPLDISSQNIALYTNLEVHSYQSTSPQFTIANGLFHLKLTGDFGKITIDENVNFLYGEKTIQTIYTCNEMRFHMKSLNKYWVSQHTEIEITLLCAKERSIGDTQTFPYSDSIIFAIPLVIIPSSTPNAFLFALSSALKNNQQSFTFAQFDFDKIFLEANELNQSTQFYFFNANNPFVCTIPQSTWFIVNNFVKIPNEMIDVFKKYFDDNTLVNNLVDYYTNKENKTIDVKRNFYINDNFSLFELEMISLSRENDYLTSSYLHINKVINVCFYIIYLLY